MTKELILQDYIRNHPGNIGKIVDFNTSKDRFCDLDLTSKNTKLIEVIDDIPQFSDWVTNKLARQNCLYGVGGYRENRTIYSNRGLFNSTEEPRSLHLGVDIWGKAGTKVYAPLDARVHSFNNNSAAGDYGATIILEHDLSGLKLFTLYGHLSLKSLENLKTGCRVCKNQPFASFGIPEENGNWPPHLHFQLIFDLYNYLGDYPGVCRYTERERWLLNSPDPICLLNFTFT